MGQLAKQIADKSSNNFVANTEQNPKEECKAMMTRSKRFVEVEDEDNVVHERRRKLLQDRTVASILKGETHFSDLLSADSPSSRENEVRGESNQEKEEQIMVKNKELKDQEKEKDIENEKIEKEEKK